MDAELFQEDAMRATFAELFALRAEQGREETGPMDMEDEDIDMNLLLNLLQSHAEGLGLPQGPAHALLSQLGLQIPNPPPMVSKRDM
jgi:hypothetical protein